jgi:signal transduction histidine kinase
MKRRLRSLLDGSPLERASWLRHLSIVVAVGVAWAMRRELLLTNQVLWILGLAAALNFGTTFLSDLPACAKTARALSSVFGIGGWAALASLSGGTSSPFIAGLWLEIIFSALVFPPIGTLLLTATAAAALWVLDRLSDRGGTLGRVWLQTGFVGVIGAVTFFASKRWVQSERTLSLRAAHLDQRLGDLEGELDDARELGQVGEGVARFAHGLKNAVHSLRGFTKLIEGPRLSGTSRRQAIEGLRLAIDRLQEIAETTLRPTGDVGARIKSWATAAEVERTLDEVVEEVGRRYHGVHWVKDRADGLPGVALSPHHLREVLLILAENAAEASGSAGEVVVKVNTERGMFHLVVRDRGPGIASDLGDRLFALGATTKASGHGVGLFLARRLIESKGGRLTAAHATGGGALFSVTLPLQEN